MPIIEIRCELGINTASIKLIRGPHRIDGYIWDGRRTEEADNNSRIIEHGSLPSAVTF